MSWGEYAGDLMPGSLAAIEPGFGAIDTYPDDELMRWDDKVNKHDEPFLIIANVVRGNGQTLGGSTRAVLILTARGQLKWVDDIKLRTPP